MVPERLCNAKDGLHSRPRPERPGRGGPGPGPMRGATPSSTRLHGNHFPSPFALCPLPPTADSTDGQLPQPITTRFPLPE